jgi:hypothetical protein
MNDAPEVIPAFEHEPVSRSIFPVQFESLKEPLHRLNTDPEAIQRLITDARRYGAANDVFVNLTHYDNGKLEAWHQDQGDFTTDGSFHYNLGLLYGVDLAQNIRSQATATPKLKADDPAAFDSAVNYLLASYDDLNGALEGWRRQKERELHLTGSDIVTVAYAGLHDRVSCMLESQNSEVRINEQAMHIGLVDGMLFVDAYDQYRNEHTPAPFEHVTEHIPSFNTNKHLAVAPGDLAAIYSIDSIDDVEQMIGHFATSKPYAISYDGGIVDGRDRFIQIGPNQFVTAYEIESVGQVDAKRYLGYYALAGIIADVGYIVTHSGAPASYVPVSTIVAVGAGLLIDRGRAKHQAKRTALLNAR